jgi:hypothetical protein
MDFCSWCGEDPCECAAGKKRAYEFKVIDPPMLKKIRAVDEDDALFDMAVRNLEPIMSGEDKQRYAPILSGTPSLGSRFAVWRAKRKK